MGPKKRRSPCTSIHIIPVFALKCSLLGDNVVPEVSFTSEAWSDVDRTCDRLWSDR